MKRVLYSSLVNLENVIFSFLGIKLSLMKDFGNGTDKNGDGCSYLKTYLYEWVK